ncbi:hypothetical protein [Pontibacter liquoris]|uniref:hypothetical protein n=1 Tax=Pontibacter liquoris TaxID=2905677 RepID=UPI001FA73255|nr:hypothetical protein [Pontibacter liquoris]
MELIDRVESKRMEKFRKIFFYLGVGSAIILTLKVFTRTSHSGTTGFLIDCLFMILPIYMMFKGYRNSKTRLGQFIEWQAVDIQYKLKEDASIKTISIKSINNINIGLDSIIVRTDTEEFVLNIEDFTNYKEIKRIKRNFEIIKKNTA